MRPLQKWAATAAAALVLAASVPQWPVATALDRYARGEYDAALTLDLTRLSAGVHEATWPDEPAVRDVHVVPGIPLVDGIFYALSFPVEPGRRHLIVVFTDGNDRASIIEPARLRDLTDRSDAVLHAVLYASPPAQPVSGIQSLRFGPEAPLRFSRPAFRRARCAPGAKASTCSPPPSAAPAACFIVSQRASTPSRRSSTTSATVTFSATGRRVSSSKAGTTSM